MKSLLFSLVLTLTAMSFAQPYLVQDVDQGGTYGGAGFYPGVEFNGWYYYSGSDTISGLELWKSDGDTCILVADLFQGTNSTTGLAEWSDPMQFTVYNNVLYFVARDSIEGYELWEYDGVSSPHLVSWLPYVGANNLANAIYCSMRVYNGSLYIIRNEYNVLYDMYKYNGVAATLITSPLTAGSFLNEFQGNLILIGTCTSCAGNSVLWEFDGVNFNQIPNTIWSTQFFGTFYGNQLYKSAIFQNKLYFSGYDSAHGHELWAYDGNTASLEVETLPGSNSGMGGFGPNSNGNNYAVSIIVYQNKLCFVASDSIHGLELWEYDGISANMIQDVNQYNPNVQSFTPFPRQIELYDDKLYFSHSSYSTGWTTDSIGLFVYDGASIQEVADVYPNHAIGTNPFGMKTAGPYLYFTATDSIHGYELWRLESCNIQNSGSQSVAVCNEYISSSGEPIYNNTILKDTLTNSCGGDSIVTTYLTVNTVDATITQNGFELQANSNNAIYQWIDCDNGGALIAGETNQEFEPTTNGNYAVIVTDLENGCVDTSACAAIVGLGVDNVNQYQFNIYPNPSTGALFISSAMNLSTAQISAYTVLGQVLAIKIAPLNDGLKITLPELATGIILLKIETPHGVFVKKVRVE